MKPVAIFRHAATEGPGFFADFLDLRGIPWQLIRIDQGDALPSLTEAFSGLVLMGGPMSVNDDLPWIPGVLGLIRDAVSKDIPVLGHCLGGQLMSKALGGTVGPNSVKEIGWGELAVADSREAQHWFGNVRHFLGFHWHGETFTMPAGATTILSSKFCPHQAFSMGKHLGFQCHIEMTADMVHTWCEGGVREVEASLSSPGVQAVPSIIEDLEERVGRLNALAAAVYEIWIKGLKA